MVVVWIIPSIVPVSLQPIASALMALTAKAASHLLENLAARKLHYNISPDMIRKGLYLYGSWHYNMKDTPKIMDVIAKSGDKLSQFITHQFPIDKVGDAWETQASGECPLR